MRLSEFDNKYSSHILEYVFFNNSSSYQSSNKRNSFSSRITVASHMPAPVSTITTLFTLLIIYILVHFCYAYNNNAAALGYGINQRT
uniref:Heat shock 70 kDa protein 8 n=1 Tax=Rhizophora mucronata TaxID=61149 RepID=A0A2P2PP18_RHIMU